MASERQLLANRRNAARSTGPRTPAGKAASARNAIRHGVFANVPVLPALGETAADLAAHRDAVVAALAPADKVELDLAERYAHLTWRLVRATLFESAAAAVGLQPAAALLANPAPAPDGPCVGLLGDPRVAEACAELVVARRAATAAPVASALLAGLTDAAADEPVDPEVVELAWRHLLDAAGLERGLAARTLLRRFWTGPGGIRTGSEPEWEYTGWTVGTVRMAVTFVAAEGGLPPDRLATLTAEAVAGKVELWRTRAEAYEAEVGRKVGAHQAAAVDAALGAVERGSTALERAVRYEGHVSREMEGVLRQLAMLRALRAARPG